MQEGPGVYRAVARGTVRIAVVRMFENFMVVVGHEFVALRGVRATYLLYVL